MQTCESDVWSGTLSLSMSVSGIVFDCDGLLVDTESCWSRAQAQLFARYGRPFGLAEKSRLIGRTVAAVCDILADEFSLPGGSARLELELLQLVDVEFESVRPMPGAIELLDTLAGRVPIAVATNSTRAMLDSTLERVGLRDYFSASVAVDEVGAPKPNPDVYFEAFRLIDAEPSCGLAFEDSATGLAAARAAGATVVAVPSLPDLRLEGDHVFASLDDLQLRAWAGAVFRR